MPEHLIRLRGGWEEIDPEGGGKPPRRVELPLRRGLDRDGCIRLLRRFGKPPTAGPEQSVWLRIARAPGLAVLRLNGLQIPLAGSEAEPEEILLENLRTRNELEIEVPAQTQAAADWGEFTIVIRHGPERAPGDRPLA